MGRSAVATSGLCRDCFGAPGEDPFCRYCGSLRLLRHPELHSLTIGHVDCDAFFASVEKRDRPELADRPVLVGGGGERGVVTAACYVARRYGIRSAMPMFKARRACPEAVVIPPDFAKYAAVARQVRALMGRLTPLVQPLSIDEAVLDLSGTQALHGASPASVLARLALEVEREAGITVSVGLAANRLTAKLAAGRGKPRGFTVLGREAAAVLAPDSVRCLPGVGPAQERRLVSRGLLTIGALQALSPAEADALLGEDGPSLVRRACLQDDRAVDPLRAARSISAETTFSDDLSDPAALERPLWRLAERLAARLRDKELAAGGVVLKLKTVRFSTRTRAARLPAPTQLPDVLFAAARRLLAREADGTAFRLIGIGAASLHPGWTADLGDLGDPDAARRVAAQLAVETLRAKFGVAVIGRGRGLDQAQDAARRGACSDGSTRGTS